VHEDEERQLALRGERSFGFIEEKEPVAGELAFEESEEGLAVRAGVEAFSTVRREDRRADAIVLQRVVKFINMSCCVEETFGTQKKPAPVRLSKERRSACTSASVEWLCSVVSWRILRLPPSGPKP